jgi:hypothetical protein
VAGKLSSSGRELETGLTIPAGDLRTDLHEPADDRTSSWATQQHPRLAGELCDTPPAFAFSVRGTCWKFSQLPLYQGSLRERCDYQSRVNDFA